MKIGNGKNTPLNQKTGTFPDVGDALLNWFQPMVFSVVTKVTEGFRVVETKVDVSFQGVWQPFSEKQISYKPEGQRAWGWYWLHADPTLELDVDDVVEYDSIQYRVKARKNYKLNDYIEYQLVEDWTGSGPEAAG